MSRFMSMLLLPLVALLALPARGEPDSTDDAIAEYRAMFGDDNPAALWETRGRELWEQPRGPKNIPLSRCDLGLGTGITRGAYTQLPRYFADTDRVQDLESRLLTCMTSLQGFAAADLVARRFGDGDRKSDLEALTAFLAAESRGLPMDVPLEHPKERAARDLGEAVFYYHAGPHDFACSTCHGQSGKRIRLQALPLLTDPAEARATYTTWPAYRVSQGELRTFEWRMTDCFRQQRLPGLEYGSDVAVALSTYLAHLANGGVMAAPAIKR